MSQWLPTPGQICRLNVSGPDVTADTVFDHQGRTMVRIVWFDDGGFQDRIVDARCLEPSTTPRGYTRVKIIGRASA